MYEALTRSGYQVLRRGWPDFLVVRPDGGVFALEWKQRGTRDFLSRDQELMHDTLASVGLPTLVAGDLAHVFSYRPPDIKTIQYAAFDRIRSNLQAELAWMDGEIKRLRRTDAQ